MSTTLRLLGILGFVGSLTIGCATREGGVQGLNITVLEASESDVVLLKISDDTNRDADVFILSSATESGRFPSHISVDAAMTNVVLKFRIVNASGGDLWFREPLDIVRSRLFVPDGGEGAEGIVTDAMWGGTGFSGVWLERLVCLPSVEKSRVRGKSYSTLWQSLPVSHAVQLAPPRGEYERIGVELSFQLADSMFVKTIVLNRGSSVH